MDHIKNLKKGKFNVVALLISICLFFVLLSHQDGYTTYLSLGVLFKLKIIHITSSFAVGGFIFLSAYKLTKSKISIKFTDFWKNRFVRIYPLYFLALILFAIFIQPDKTLLNFIIHALFLKTLFPNLGSETYLTLWFVGLLFLYYLYFSIFKKQIKKGLRFTFLSISFFIILFLIRYLLQDKMQIIASEFFIYYFIFIFGMLFAYYEKQVRFYTLHKIFLLLISATSIFFLFLYLNNMLSYNHILLHIFFIFFSFVPIYIFILSINSKFALLNKPLNILAYASLGMFLFHRPIWKIMNNLWNQPNLIQWIYIVLLGTLIIFGVSYGIQYIYDKAIHFLKKNKK